jgi:proline iminopeptidase
MRQQIVASRRYLSLILLLGAAAYGQEGGPQPSPGADGPPTLEKRLNLHEIAPQVICGAIPPEADIPALVQEKKVTRVISLLDEAEVPPGEAAALKGAGVEYVHVPVQVPGASPTDTHLDLDAVRRTLELLSSGKDGVTYLHCKTGTNRVQAVNIAYKVLVEKQTYAAAVREAVLAGFRVDQRPHFLSDLKKLIAGVEDLPLVRGIPITEQDLSGPGEFLNVGGQKLHVKKRGQGPAIITVHGGPGETHKPFRPYLDRLAQKHTLVYYDQRGCGLSSKPQFEEAYTLDRLVKELDGLREALGFEKVRLVAHSSGSAIAAKYALAHPDRVEKLVLTSGWASAEEFGKYGSMTIALLNAADREKYVRSVQRLRNEGRSSFNDAEIADLTRLLYPHDFFGVMSPEFQTDWGRRAEVSSMANKAESREFLQELDLRPELPKIQGIPTLVIAGRFDVVVPPDVVKGFADGIPGARFEVLPLSGHYSFVEENEAWLELVESFLAQ